MNHAGAHQQAGFRGVQGCNPSSPSPKSPRSQDAGARPRAIRFPISSTSSRFSKTDGRCGEYRLPAVEGCPCIERGAAPDAEGGGLRSEVGAEEEGYGWHKVRPDCFDWQMPSQRSTG